jgi:hypothetical protein
MFRFSQGETSEWNERTNERANRASERRSVLVPGDPSCSCGCCFFLVDVVVMVLVLRLYCF